MKNLGKNPAFTLLEMIIAITVFTIFIGFSISTYLSFHRADQEALEQRSLMLEIQGTMDQISEAVRSNKIDYSGAYSEEETGSGRDILGSLSDSLSVSLFGASHVLNEKVLSLVSPDGATKYVYTWDDDEEVQTLSLQVFDLDEGAWVAADGYTEGPVLLHGENTKVTYANFRIFPDVDPYDSDNASDDDVQYQPTVQINLTFSVPGRVRPTVDLELQTSITSRFYQ